jgi:hypothetical protein
MSRAPLRTITPHGTRLTRRGGGQAPLEALAAEFALLAQRRGRVTRQLELLDRQRIAAAATLRLVEARLTILSGKMHAPVVAVEMPLPEPAALPPPPPRFLPTREQRLAPRAEASAAPARAAAQPVPAPAAEPAPATQRTVPVPRWKRGLVLEY